jgi:hypothetical protein
MLKNASAKSNSIDLSALEDSTSIKPNFIAWVSELNQLTEVEATNKLRTRRNYSVEEVRYLADNIKFPRLAEILESQANSHK